MSKAVYTLDVDQGMTYSRRFVWKINSNPVNLTGYTAQLIVGTGSSSTYKRGLTLTSAVDGGIVLGTSDGSIEVTFSPSQTSSLSAGSNSYALELTSPSGTKTRVLRGTLNNHPRVPNVC
jgi:hypothetical protein